MLFRSAELRSFVERIERLEVEKKDLGDDIRAVHAEAKTKGFDVPALRALIKLRKQDAAARAEHEAIVAEYEAALGDLATLPLGRAAKRRAGIEAHAL